MDDTAVGDADGIAAVMDGKQSLVGMVGKINGVMAGNAIVGAGALALMVMLGGTHNAAGCIIAEVQAGGIHA